jgi:adenylate cyclase
MIYLWNMAYGFFVEAQAKRQFTDLFGQYVPPELVEKMAENPERYDMKGQRKELTVMFSDVRGFTSISEKLSPSDLAEYINEYLSSMSLIIRQEGGTLDKYIGDAIMAFWGAPVDEPRHALCAVRAALRMRDEIKVLSERFREKNWPQPEIGVGLSTGDMTVGDMGSSVRKAYTVMGDAVNVGSRLEGLTRQLGAFCLVPLATKDACPEIVFREVDVVRVKGKAEPVRIYEPVCLVSDANEVVLQELLKWHEAIALMRQHQWDQALEVLAALVSMYGEEYRVQILREKIVRLKHQPPGPNWDGVTNFETK